MYHHDMKSLDGNYDHTDSNNGSSEIDAILSENLLRDLSKSLTNLIPQDEERNSLKSIEFVVQ